MTTTLDWYGCATFAMRTAGLTIMLDAYIDRMEGADGPKLNGQPLTADDVQECDWIAVGHAHFDHLAGAERIMKNTNARLIANYEAIRLMEQAGVPTERMICVAGGETIDLGNDVTVSVYPSQHSCVWSQTQMSQADTVCLGDLGVTWQEQQARMAELMKFVAGLGQSALDHLTETNPGHSDRGDGGALIFLFTMPDGSVLFQDTSGHWSGIIDDLKPDVALLAAAGRGNVDGEPIQGSLADFVAQQVKALGPKRVVLTHHDNWMPGFSVATDVGPIRDAISTASPTTELLDLGYLDGTPIL